MLSFQNISSSGAYASDSQLPVQLWTFNLTELTEHTMILKSFVEIMIRLESFFLKFFVEPVVTLGSFFFKKSSKDEELRVLQEKCSALESQLEVIYNQRRRDMDNALQEMEWLEERAAVNIELLMWTAPRTLAQGLIVQGFQCRTGVDVANWLATSVRNVPRDVIQQFVRGALAQYRFILNYLEHMERPIVEEAPAG